MDQALLEPEMARLDALVSKVREALDRLEELRTALISDVPLLRDAGQGFGRGFDDVVWIRGQGYDPLVPPGDPRAGKVRLRDEPGPLHLRGVARRVGHSAHADGVRRSLWA